MSRFLVESRVRAMAKNKGKQAGKSYMNWLDRKVSEIVERSCHAAGTGVRLNAEDSEAYEKKSLLVR